jgi:hypothetical protein
MSIAHINLTRHTRPILCVCIGALFNTCITIAIAEDAELTPPGFYEAEVVVRDEKFGRLFFTPEQRQLLDRVRQPGTNTVANDSETDNPVASNPPPNTQQNEVRLSGVLVRGDGKHMVWINGRSELSAQKDPNVRAGKPQVGSILVPVHTQQKTTLLKPGQVWLINEKQVKEAHQVKPVVTENKPGSAANDVSGQILDDTVDAEQ